MRRRYRAGDVVDGHVVDGSIREGDLEADVSDRLGSVIDISASCGSTC